MTADQLLRSLSHHHVHDFHHHVYDFQAGDRQQSGPYALPRSTDVWKPITTSTVSVASSQLTSGMKICRPQHVVQGTHGGQKHC